MDTAKPKETNSESSSGTSEITSMPKRSSPTEDAGEGAEQSESAEKGEDAEKFGSKSFDETKQTEIAEAYR